MMADIFVSIITVRLVWLIGSLEILFYPKRYIVRDETIRISSRRFKMERCCEPNKTFIFRFLFNERNVSFLIFNELNEKLESECFRYRIHICILYRQSFLAFVTKRSFVIKQSNKFLIPLDIRPKITSTRDRTFRCVRRERERYLMAPFNLPH